MFRLIVLPHPLRVSCPRDPYFVGELGNSLSSPRTDASSSVGVLPGLRSRQLAEAGVLAAAECRRGAVPQPRLLPHSRSGIMGDFSGALRG